MSTSWLLIHRPHLPVSRGDDSVQQELFELEPRPEALCYRGQTLAIMRHFFELSCHVGRLPSLLGREFFRARVSHHAIPSFEEQAVFVCDVESCMERLDDAHAEMVRYVGLYDFSCEEIAAMLRCSVSAVYRQVAQALDCLSEIFLRAGVLREYHPDRRQCQVNNRSLPADVVAAGAKKPCTSVKVPGEGTAAGPIVAWGSA